MAKEKIRLEAERIATLDPARITPSFSQFQKSAKPYIAVLTSTPTPSSIGDVTVDADWTYSLVLAKQNFLYRARTRKKTLARYEHHHTLEIGRLNVHRLSP
ncbi:hypothetical protein KR51_00028310 [Rubidibacter lacunae KORDI 51-2]|uniref:Uncharacterized protein n=1 Tax=Rubidibacter lacunae KORDI 51-2 TaxID=582515 RepID=U5DJA4_9CHRO|nr:hypothetical protein KR51_00028310 [Rubidibacter lacunae KORDI 51-2]